MKDNIFQMQLDCSITKKLREVVNSEINISLKKRQNLKINRKIKEYPAWGLICAIMDRLDDTVQYLNSLQLNTGKYRRSAFDFFNFMNQASVVIDCVDMLANIYDVSLLKINNSIAIFNQIGRNEKGTDKKYFEYLRSLCSVHPVETSHFENIYQDDIESSPYVIWNDGFIWHDNCDLNVIVYTNKDQGDEYHKRIQIKISEIFDYVTFRYNLLNDVIVAIEQYHQIVILDYKRRYIKTPNEFNNYIDYLKNLKMESDERFDDANSYHIEFAISLFNLKITNNQNNEQYKKFCNVFKYAIEFEHNALQNMTYEGFENNGIKFPERNVETTLLCEIHSANSWGEERNKYGYNIGKVHYLDYDSGLMNKQWAYQMIDEAMSFFKKYVDFEDASDDFENYALIMIALYFDCFEHKCSLNKNIPNDLKFRNELLTQYELQELLTEDPVNKNASFDLMEFLDNSEGIAEDDLIE